MKNIHLVFLQTAFKNDFLLQVLRKTVTTELTTAHSFSPNFFQGQHTLSFEVVKWYLTMDYGNWMSKAKKYAESGFVPVATTAVQSQIT